MIVRHTDGTLLLITQPDHAALAATLMRAWRAGGIRGSGRRGDVLVAVEEHDNGWLEVDAAPLVDAAGRVCDFLSAPDDVRRGVWPRGVRRLAGAPYAAALVAQHALHVLRRYRDEETWAAWFTEMETARAHHLAAAGLRGTDELRRDYLFLRVADIASLTFCNAWTEPQIDDAGSGCTVRLQGETLLISPDPFEAGSVPFAVAARRLAGEPFASAAAARLAYAAAETIVLHGVARGA